MTTIFLQENSGESAIISIGSRAHATRTARFRQWAIRVLRGHLAQGYSPDRERSAACRLYPFAVSFRNFPGGWHEKLMPPDDQ